MKKLLLTAAIAAVSTSAIADDKLYVRGDVGASFIPKDSMAANTTNVNSTLAGIAVAVPVQIAKSKSKITNHLVADLGVGMYISDMVRVELNLANHFNSEQNFKPTLSVAGVNVGSASIKAKFKATSLNAKFVADVYNFGYGDVFLGAGLGLTKLSSKRAFSFSPSNAITSTTTYTYKTKAKNNMNFLVTAGIAFDVAEGVKIDVAYSYNDHGKTNDAKDINGKKVTGTKLRFRTHDVTAGVRVEL